MAGSHDYLREDSAYRKAKWTKNVHGFLSGKPEVIELEKLHTKVYGCSYEQPQITEPVYSTIRPDDQPGIHILLAYGGDETHIPMKKEDGAGFTYVALGYRHLPGVLVENQMAYAGSRNRSVWKMPEHTVSFTERLRRMHRAHITRRLHWFPVRVVLIFRCPYGSIPARHRPVWNRKYRMRFSRREAERSTGFGSRDTGTRNWNFSWSL